MRRSIFYLIISLVFSLAPVSLYSQKQEKAVNLITSSDLKSNISFLASPLLKGRMNGEEGLEIAGQYLAAQAKLTGLKPANGNSFFQPYSILKKSIDLNKTSIQIISSTLDTVIIKEPLIQVIPMEPTDLTLDGEVVFAGYGIKNDKYNYNDLDSIKTEGKILLVMNRAPMSEDGKVSKFDEPGWNTEQSLQMKLTTLILSKAKAILFVTDPKSGFKSYEEANPEFAGYIKSKVTLKNDVKENNNPFMSVLPKVIFIHRAVADALLKGSGHTLEELQKNIDTKVRPHSFEIKDKELKITEVTITEEKILNNVAGYTEGSDPVLKNELVIFSSHYDHIGTSGGKVNTGADDDASGCAALLSMAKALQGMKKKPLRSILFLWVSGEEIGLYGSKSYVENPLFPLKETVTDLNVDMIGRDKETADSTEDTPMTGPNSVFVISDSQSKDLVEIANETARKGPLKFDYSLSGRSHPLQLFARSDHYNFVEKSIPILCFTSGIHSDYHTPRDVVEKIDFNKLELVTRTVFEIGLTVANKKSRLTVDNPFSSWGKTE
jgi:hypothetical protein